MNLNFAELQKNYPKDSREALFEGMGGQWPSLINDDNYRNTCAIRLSIALHRSGHPIPSSKREAINGSGDSIIIKVKTFGDFLASSLGSSNWGMSKQPGQPIAGAIPKKTGIIVYHANWSDATGHFDLWTGTEFVGSGSTAGIKDGYDIEMWWLP